MKEDYIARLLTAYESKFSAVSIPGKEDNFLASEMS